MSTKKDSPSTPDAPLRSIKDIIADLSKPIQARHLKSKDQGGKKLTFIPWYFAVDYLDHYAPGWSYVVEKVVSVPGGYTILVNNKIVKLSEFKKTPPKPDADVQFIAQNQVAVTVSISIPCKEGVVTRHATGQEDAEVVGYGDSTSNSESMALRRAASKFGLGRYLYKKTS